MGSIKIKRKLTPGSPTSLEVGEPAINTSENKFFIGVNSSVVKWIGAEIEDSVTNPSVWSNDIKLATKKSIGDSFALLSGPIFTGDVLLSGGSDIRFIETGGGSDYVGFQAPVSVASSVIWILPSSDGSAGQALKTSGSAVLEWGTFATLGSNTFTGLNMFNEGLSVDGVLSLINEGYIDGLQIGIDVQAYDPYLDYISGGNFVSSFNGSIGDVSIEEGTNITIVQVGSTYTISSTAETATNATNVAITSVNNSASYFVPFLSAATGNIGLNADAGTGANGLTYNPAVATLTTGTISAALVQATTISTSSIGGELDITIEPIDFPLTIAPTTSDPAGGTSPSLTVGYLDNAADFVTVAGGDLYLSTKTNSASAITPVNIIFEGATANNFETTLTVTDPTADRTITLPNATGTVALTTDLSQFAATSSAQLAGIMSDETGSGALVFATSPVLTTPNLGTPSALVGTNITGTASGFTAGAVTNAGLTGEVTTSGLAATLTNSAVIGKVITGYTSGSGVVAATDTILQAIQKLNGNAVVGVADAGALTGATLASNVLASSLTSVGTLSALTVTATIVGSINGNAATATTATNVTTNANLTGHITSTGNATVLGTAAFSSANLASALTDETGSGAAVFATSPTLVTPALGTPSALVGTNISGTGASFTAGTATNATNVAITSDNTATSYFVPFVTAATGNNGLKADAGTGANGLTYIPSTATLTTGNVIATGATLQTLTSAGDLSITTASGTTNDVTVAPFGIITLSPTSSVFSGGTFPSIVVSNSDAAAGLVTIAGGDLYLGQKVDADPTAYPVNIIFEGATADGFETTLTVTDPTADRTITLPNATGTVALTTDLSQFAATSSAQLATLISDETGSGALVFATSPTLVTPALGTPSALVGTNITGTGAGFTAGTVTTNANLTGHITSPGNATVLGTAAFSSANLAGALTDETGTGAAVFATSPTLVTPALGEATATSLAAGNTGVKVGEHVSRFLTITSDGSNTAITQNGNSASTLTISHAGYASIYIGDSDGNNNSTYIDVNDDSSTITLNGSTVLGPVTADAYKLSSAGISAKTASYTLVAGDNGKIITMNVASANNLTVPASLDVGFNCTVIQLGAGQTTIVASGTTLNSYQGYLKISGQHGSASIVSYVSNVYNVAGSLSA